jgi:hypothetical protein
VKVQLNWQAVEERVRAVGRPETQPSKEGSHWLQANLLRKSCLSRLELKEVNA